MTKAFCGTPPKGFEVMNANRPFRALWIWQDTAPLPILPLRGAKVLLYMIGAIAVIAFLVDWRLASLATDGRVNLQEWVIDNQTIKLENHSKIQNNITSPIFRSLGYAPPQPSKDRKRILVIGDSFIWGDGLTNINMTWWRQLQWELDRRGYRNVDVVAAGTNGASTQDQYGWLTSGKLLEQTKPDVIVFGYVTNDPQMKDVDGRDMVKQRSLGAGVDLTSSAVGRFFPNLAFEISNRINNKREYLAGEESGYPYGLWELKILEGENFKAYKRLLAQLAKTLDEASIPAFFITTPNSPNADSFEPRYAPIRPAFKEAGIRLVDLLPPLLECCSRIEAWELLWSANPANGHPGSRMAQFYAGHVANILEKEYPQVLGLRSQEKDEAVPKVNDWHPSSLSPRQIAAGEWEVNVPIDKSRQLFMPVRKPHFALNFERPVNIKKISLHSDKAIVGYQVWAQVLSDEGNYELRDYVLLGEGTGPSTSISMPPALSGKRVTSLRISADSKEPAVREVLALDPSKMSQSEGYSYNYPLPPDLEEKADEPGFPSRSEFVLLENGRVLTQAHAIHADIRSHGAGSYSHWGSGLLFSSSDNGDPRKGKRYSLGVRNSLPIKITIESEAKAARP